MTRKIFFMIALACSTLLVQAQKALRAGDFIGNIELMGTDDRLFSLNAQKGAKGFIIVFMSNSCDHCIKYKDRIIALDNRFKKKGFPVVAIAPYGDDPIKYPLDAMPKMKEWVRAKNIRFPYLADRAFKYSYLFGIRHTPEAVILQRKGSQYEIKYIGDIDDNPELKKPLTNRYVENILAKIS
ncbi:thioredoxin family protein [Pedobacter yulinensis]|uniref:Thioredoxin family protein n=1 Tax=Pedobacter yulinensis TaxID=2126353 RepID=A0A2T3HLA7_9SPHI|nr:redoxin domain-containing protein [Pedobacter yulinensis]PST83220.1 thioredoxin family protein [Pedobacter yulinensis]